VKTLRQLMAHAFDRGVHGYNPVAEFAHHHQHSAGRATIKRPSTTTPLTLSQEEVPALLAAAPSAWQLAFQLIASTGLRTSELLALEWQDIDDDVVRVRRQRRADGTSADFQPTNPRRREIPLPATLAHSLAARRQTPTPTS